MPKAICEKYVKLLWSSFWLVHTMV